MHFLPWPFYLPPNLVREQVQLHSKHQSHNHHILGEKISLPIYTEKATTMDDQFLLLLTFERSISKLTITGIDCVHF
jgi:hypothetical protein